MFIYNIGIYNVSWFFYRERLGARGNKISTSLRRRTMNKDIRKYLNFKS